MIKGLNSNLAFFISSCLSLMDRGFVFQLVKTYLRGVSGQHTFLICGHFEPFDIDLLMVFL